ncbi:PadR family transcriptional regulator [Kineosporiaceae bacterium B12]|nr:PadR family transcriptional regulator [Kineococcus rubinsiae]NIZ93292.1 PadR family transcriptional regulator [Kineococcus rubinsiae]
MEPTQLLKGVLDLAVLAVVAREDGYGYDVVRRLRAGGLAEVGDASVYGTLRRLYAAGALTSYVVPSEEGPHRKYYGINAQGEQVLAQQRASWRGFADSVDRLLGPAPAGSPGTTGSSGTTSVPLDDEETR